MTTNSNTPSHGDGTGLAEYLIAVLRAQLRELHAKDRLPPSKPSPQTENLTQEHADDASNEAAGQQKKPDSGASNFLWPDFQDGTDGNDSYRNPFRKRFFDDPEPGSSSPGFFYPL